MAATDCVLGGCEDTLPPVSFDEDCGGEASASEIEEIYVGNAGTAAFADWTDPAEWATRLSQSLAVSGNEIRKLIVVGDKPAAQPAFVTISKKRRKKTDAAHTINFEIDDVNQDNYDFALKMQCGTFKRIWYKTRGGNLFGGNEGVLVFFNINPVLGRGEEIEKLVGDLTWNNRQDPLRIDSPI